MLVTVDWGHTSEVWRGTWGLLARFWYCGEFSSVFENLAMTNKYLHWLNVSVKQYVIAPCFFCLGVVSCIQRVQVFCVSSAIASFLHSISSQSCFYVNSWAKAAPGQHNTVSALCLPLCKCKTSKCSPTLHRLAFNIYQQIILKFCH